MNMARIGKGRMLMAVLGGLLFAGLAQAEPRLAVTVTPNPVEESESTQLRIEVIAPEAPVFEPTFDAPDFSVMGRSQPSKAGRVEIRNGKQVLLHNYIYTIVLIPKRAGQLLIRNIRVRVGSETLKSEDLRVKVVEDSGNGGFQPPGFGQGGMGRGIFPPGLLDDEDEDQLPNPAAPPQSASPQPGGKAANALPRFNSDFTVVGFINKQKFYVGEPVVVEYYLYDYGAVRGNLEIVKWPSFNGFVKEDLEIAPRHEFEDIYVGNQLMRRVFIGRFAIYSLKPGKYNLDKMQIKAKYVSSDRMQGSPFQVFNLSTGMHASQDVPLEVIPLPEAGRPANFGGAVGQFTMKLEADKTTLAQNSSLTLNLNFQGVGNFQAIDSVKLPLPPDFELYESTTNSRGNAPIGIRRELESQKTFQVVAIPRKAGKFEIPPFHWSFYNPKKQAYETLSTQPISLEVTASTNTAVGQNSYVSPTEPGSAPAPNPESEVAPLKLVSFEAKGEIGSLVLKIALAVLALLNLFLLARLLRTKLSLFGRLYRNIDPLARPRAELMAAKRSPGANWQSTIEDALYGIQNALLRMNTRGLTKYELEEQWQARGLPPTLYQKIQNVFQELDRSRFSSTKQGTAGHGSFREKIQKESEAILKEAGRHARKR